MKEIIRQYPAREGRELSGVAACEQRAVRAAIDATRRMEDCQERMLVVELVLWRGTHRIPGAALNVPCSERTARRWQHDFIIETARNFKCDSLI